jgi:hypothetical protein
MAKIGGYQAGETLYPGSIRRAAVFHFRDYAEQARAGGRSLVEGADEFASDDREPSSVIPGGPSQIDGLLELGAELVDQSE